MGFSLLYLSQNIRRRPFAVTFLFSIHCLHLCNHIMHYLTRMLSQIKAILLFYCLITYGIDYQDPELSITEDGCLLGCSTV
jgi:hypothetical protein